MIDYNQKDRIKWIYHQKRVEMIQDAVIITVLGIAFGVMLALSI